MKEKELRDLATCVSCGKKIGESGIPLFTRIKIERFGIKVGACERQTGLAMLLGNARLAQVMGTDEDLAISVADEVVASLYHGCETSPVVIAEIHEIAGRLAEHAAGPSR